MVAVNAMHRLRRRRGNRRFAFRTRLLPAERLPPRTSRGGNGAAMTWHRRTRRHPCSCTSRARRRSSSSRGNVAWRTDRPTTCWRRRRRHLPHRTRRSLANRSCRRSKSSFGDSSSSSSTRSSTRGNIDSSRDRRRRRRRWCQLRRCSTLSGSSWRF